MKKFTFKKYVPTGRYKSFELDQTDIKLNKKVVGTINQQSGYYKVSFFIKIEPTKEKPAPFKLVRYKKLFNSEKEARQFVLENNEKIQTTLDLHYFDR